MCKASGPSYRSMKISGVHTAPRMCVAQKAYFVRAETVQNPDHYPGMIPDIDLLDAISGVSTV